MDLYKKRYRISSHRRAGWNYANNALYFITLVVQNRICYLGEIQKGQMILSEFGDIVKNAFLKSFEIRHELKLDSFVIMPNHIHAVVVIDHPPIISKNIPYEISQINPPEIPQIIQPEISQIIPPVETHGRASLRGGADTNGNRNEFVNQGNKPIPFRQPKSLSSFIAGFKSAVNSQIDDYIDAHQINLPKFNRKNHFFQPNYHDHIIRNEQEYYRITQYILNNPKNWQQDSLKETSP